MLFFSPKNPQIVGVDITSTSVKLLELRRTGGGYRVEGYAVEPLPTNAVVEKNISDIDAVGNSLRKAVKRAGTKATCCAVAVPASAAISKLITMPAGLNDDELESQVLLEADQYIPYSLDEVRLDFEVLGPSENNADTIDVLLAASRSENVDMRTAAAELAGLTPKVVDIESYAMEGACQLLHDLDDTAVVAVIDIGATMTSVNILQHGQLIYTREQSFGGRQLTEEIMRRFGLSYDEAGLAKKEGGLPDNYVIEVLNPFKETVVQQVHRLLQFFYAANQHNEVAQIVLAGGCSCIPGIDELVEEKMHVRTTIANPFSGMSFSPKISQQRLGNDAPSMMIATGLALRSFD